MTMDDIVLRILDLIENEARSCSMDFGCITPLYVYRMLGGQYSMEEIQDVLSVCSKERLKGNGCFVHTSLFQGEDK